MYHIHIQNRKEKKTNGSAVTSVYAELRGEIGPSRFALGYMNSNGLI